MSQPGRETIDPGQTRRFSLRLPRPLWFFLATALLIVLGLGLRVGVPMYKKRVAEREIERLGGWCRSEPGGPDWLRSWLGDERMELFDHVVAAHLAGEITGAGLRPLRWFTALRELDLSLTSLTDDAFVHLHGLPSLERLDLTFTQVTDNGLVQLQGLRNLRFLDLYGTHITDAGLVHVGGMLALQELSLDGTEITDAGLAHLATLRHLERLSVEATQITDAGLVHLSRLTTLRELQLDGTQVTDAGLKHLYGLTGLESLSIYGTSATIFGYMDLREALPKVGIQPRMDLGF